MSNFLHSAYLFHTQIKMSSVRNRTLSKDEQKILNKRNMLYIIGGLNQATNEQNYYVNVVDSHTQLDVRLLYHLNGRSVIKGCKFQKVRATSLSYIEEQLRKYPDKALYTIPFNGVGVSESNLCGTENGFQLLHITLSPKTYLDRFPLVRRGNQSEEVGQVVYQIYNLLLLCYNQGLHDYNVPVINNQRWVLKGFKIKQQEIHIFISCEMSAADPSYTKFTRRWSDLFRLDTIKHLFYIDENDLMKDLQKCSSDMLRKVVFNGLNMEYSLVLPAQLNSLICQI